MHRFIPSPDEPAPAINPEHAEAIRRWTRATLKLSDDAVILVNDTPCLDAGCPLVETRVSVFEDTGTRTWVFTRPKIAVTQMMVRQTLATPPRSGGADAAQK